MNKEHFQKYKQDYYKNNLNSILEKRMKYYNQNKDKINTKRRELRALKKNNNDVNPVSSQ